ncbi:MAG: viroplasmin family protein [Proteocatella sp.]
MKIYGVYGKNGGGVYTNWQKVLESRRYIDGIKNKAFKSRIEAIAFIIKGLEQDYGVVGEGELSREVFEKRNWFYRLVDFEK